MHRAIRWLSCRVVRIFCEVMSHSAINRSVDKVRCPRGKLLIILIHQLIYMQENKIKTQMMTGTGTVIY